MAQEHRTFCVYGHVQGVFFRQSAQQEARLLGLTGYARNNDDNTVTIEAEGPTEALGKLAAWCQHGPSTAKVERVEETVGEVKGYTDFEVRRH